MKVLTTFVLIALFIFFISSTHAGKVFRHKNDHQQQQQLGADHDTLQVLDHKVKGIFSRFNHHHQQQQDTTAASPPVGPCDVITKSSPPFCNTSLPLDQRINDLIDRIPVDEMPGLFSNTAQGSKTAGIPPYQWWSEGLHGVAYSPGNHFRAPTPYATSFPEPSLSAASFNTDLFNVIGDTIGREGRAMNNVGNAGLTYWAPNINLVRSPLWGRAMETPGEDTILTSHYAHHFIRGMQNNSMDPTRLRVSACAKHFFAYDLENWGGASRHSFNAVLEQDEVYQMYLAHFEAAYSPYGGHASGSMCSYNAETITQDGVSNTPSCANEKFLNGMIRSQFGGDLYITSDCGAVEDVYANHKFVNTSQEAVGVTLRAGMDIDCGSVVQDNLKDALANGHVSLSTVKKALYNQFRVLFRLGNFDPIDEQPYKKLGPQDVNTPAAKQAAYQAAAEGITLLQINRKQFPLSNQTVRRIALLGGNADAPITQLGNYYGKPENISTPLSALQQYVDAVHYMEGCKIDSFNALEFASACQLVESGDVDAVVLVIGSNTLIESEGHDRTSLALPSAQDLFVKQMATCAATKNLPFVVVSMTGSSVDYSQILKLPNLSALLWAGYGGQAMGQAIADVIFGKVNPSGRLPHTIYPASFAQETSMFNMQYRSDPATNHPGYTYKFYTGAPVFPFGHGLSFTYFAAVFMNSTKVTIPSDLKARPSALTPICTLTFAVENVGMKHAGKYSLLLMFKNKNATEDRGHVRPPLTGFAKTRLLKYSEQQFLNVNVHLYSVLKNGHTLVPGAYQWSIFDMPSIYGELVIPPS